MFDMSSTRCNDEKYRKVYRLAFLLCWEGEIEKGGMGLKGRQVGTNEGGFAVYMECPRPGAERAMIRMIYELYIYRYTYQ